MLVKAISALLLVTVTMPQEGGGLSGSSGSSGNGSASVDVWEGKEFSGGSSTARNKKNCTRWEKINSAPMVDPELLAGQKIDGRTYFFYARSCNGEAQYRWIAARNGRDLSRAAYAEATARAPDPKVTLSPPGGELVVNLETWFAVTPMERVSATASLPGISATVRLVPTSITFETGSRAPGDKRVIHCKPWGSTKAARGGCAWTPRYPSLPRFTGGGKAFHATVTVTWAASWTSSDGGRGTLDAVTTSTDLDLVVREVQTIGGKPGG